MKTILSSRKHHFVAKVCIFLIMVALITGMVGCGGTATPRYDLSMAVAPAGGGTATDLTNTSPYAGGTGVNIKAVANPGYQFVSWTAPAGAFANPNVAQTTLTMPAEDVTVTANFAVAGHNLIMAVNPVGGGTATDLTGASPYAAGTVVNIKAVANTSAGYQFVRWTAPAGTFVNPNLATAKFTMPAQNVSITANFVGSLDHRKIYLVDQETAPYIGQVVYLEDQFAAVNATVEQAVAFSNPAEKVHGEKVTPILSPDHYVTAYNITYEDEPHMWFVQVYNQFGTQNLTVWGPILLIVPTEKLVPGGHEPPVGLDHFLQYYVVEGPSINETVDLNDQFCDDPQVVVGTAAFFNNPVRITCGGNVTEIQNPEAHMVVYSIGIEGEYFETEVRVVNQFGEQTLDVYGPGYLAVPSELLFATPF